VDLLPILTGFDSRSCISLIFIC